MPNEKYPNIPPFFSLTTTQPPQQQQPICTFNFLLCRFRFDIPTPPTIKQKPKRKNKLNPQNLVEL